MGQQQGGQDIVKVAEGKVCHTSPGRCGSTLISQILRDLFGYENVVATDMLIGEHHDRRVVITHRDFRQALVSHWRVRCIQDDGTLEEGRKMTRKEVLEYIYKTRRLCGFMDKNADDNPHALIMAYDKFYNNYEYIYDEFEKYFDIELPREERDRLTAEYSLEKNKERASKMTGFSKYDDSMIHGRHIYKDGKSSWKDYLDSEELVDSITIALMPHLKRWGYRL